ncbi:MAG: hypothetical protein ACRCZF_27555 [Gemmataceae bacterium]
MTPARFLADEHTPVYWIDAVRQANPAISYTRIGQPGAPPVGTRNGVLLRYCEANQTSLITCDDRTMYGHLVQHLESGGRFYGLFFIHESIRTQELVDSVVIIYSLCTAEELIDVIGEFPLPYHWSPPHANF